MEIAMIHRLFLLFLILVSSIKAFAVATIQPSAKAVPGGIEISVDIKYDPGQGGIIPVKLTLQGLAPVRGNDHAIVNLLDLSNGEITPSRTNSTVTYTLKYDDINRRLARAGFANMKVADGTKLWVLGEFTNRQAMNGRHVWGGYSRNGEITLPASTSASGANVTVVEPQELDLAVKIDAALRRKYNKGNEGLVANGQIRSRLEAEGKYQLTEGEFDTVVQDLLKLANDPALAEKVLGKEWSIALETRYLKKTPTGQLRMSGGLPVPDPMVDTYYDDRQRRAAQNDMAIRYRYTAGNNSGAWNFKPNGGRQYKDGTVFRTEYGLDTTSGDPKIIKDFVDSNEIHNPFRLLRDVIPGANPSDFFEPSVKITDDRFKFLLKHQNGLAIEVSADRVVAEDLRAPRSERKEMKFWQLEMDIDHLATTSSNVVSATPQRAPGGSAGTPQISLGTADRGRGLSLSQFTGAGGNQSAGLFGQNGGQMLIPGLHTLDSMAPSSQVRQRHEGEFDLARSVMKKLVKHTLGTEYLLGAQKYAFSAYRLGLLSRARVSPSVEEVIKGNGGTCRGLSLLN
jgi:hypothetical protein